MTTNILPSSAPQTRAERFSGVENDDASKPVAVVLARAAPVDSMRAFRTEPRKFDFVLPGLPKGLVGSIISPGGVGKSTLALSIAAYVATGKDVSGISSSAIQIGGPKRPTGKVVYLAAEDPELAIEHRLHALGKYLSDSERDAFAAAVIIEPLAGMGADLARPEWIKYIRDCCKGTRLLLIDTLRVFHSCDENDGAAMSALMMQLVMIAREEDCCIVFLHHSSKSAALNEQGDTQQASRGSSVLTDNIRWQMYLIGCSKKEAEKYGIDDKSRKMHVRVGISKQNYDEPVDEIWVRKKGGVLVPAEFATSYLTAKKSDKKDW